jgi:eukaryotic-like serine/threonine-protein kinase
VAFFICQSCGTEYEAQEPKCPACGRTETIRLNRSDRLVDKVIAGRFKIIRKLGQGGMGAVYLAEQLGIGHRVALKFLKSEFSTDVEIARRFLNEAKTYARVTHPNAVTFHEFGQDDEGNLFIAMEYCDGVDLKKTIADRGRLSIVEGIEVVTQVADVLGEAHEKQIVHRDLKPENIMIRKSLRGMHAKVLDFGIARILDASTKLTVAGAIAGTPRYMSPEQVEGREADRRADIYSLGIVCFEALTGRQPFDGGTIAEIMRKQVLEPLPRLSQFAPELDLPALQAALDKACAKRRDDRFPDMMSFASALSQAIPTQLHMASPPMQRLATESRRQAVSAATPSPAQQTGIATGTLVDSSDGDAATMMRTPSPGPGVGSTIPALATGPQSAVAPNGIGSLDLSKDLRPDPQAIPEAPLEVPKSKGPLFAIAGLAVIAAVIGVVLATKGTGPTANGSPPDVKPVIEPVKVPDQPTPSNDDAVKNAALLALKNQSAQGSLRTGRASWEKGELEAAQVDLLSVEKDTEAWAEAQRLLADIKTVTESIGAGDAAFRRGDCAGALKAYQVAAKLNQRVPAVNAGISKCKAAAIPENVE